MPYKNVLTLVRKLGKPLTILDTETTGLGAAKTTGIVDIAYLTFHPDGRVVEFETLINPTQPIQKGASEIHGLWPDDVKDAPRFRDMASALHGPFHKNNGGHIISGFNSQGYDTPIIIERLIEHLPASSVHSVDEVVHLDVRVVYTDGNRYMKGKLFQVAEEYGVKVDLAHRAMADVKTTALVLESMIERHGEEYVLSRARYPGYAAKKRSGQSRGNPVRSGFSVPKSTPPADLFMPNRDLDDSCDVPPVATNYIVR